MLMQQLFIVVTKLKVNVFKVKKKLKVNVNFTSFVTKVSMSSRQNSGTTGKFVWPTSRENGGLKPLPTFCDG